VARILIVEDEPLISLMLEDWLTEMGHEPVGPAVSIDRAIAMSGEGPLDAALLDLNLHGQRCDAVADVLSRNAIPFAFATGSDVGSLPRQFASLPTISKPYDFETVQRVLAALLEGSGSTAPQTTSPTGN